MKQPTIAHVQTPGFWIIYWNDGTTSCWSASSWTFEAISAINGVVDVLYSANEPTQAVAVV